ncbi:MAG: serine--tRNA ligase [Candidatus Nealsonbacteria bacterium RIFOXYB1_FULL_40_15]|uniref:Serine--tRNA ligase n=2 Tax=Candidatus Nealsoniibacteriota TaxID=1817911 RepID=A0A1G2EQP7_9BACT|nr:MAG: serine--tRNA ligase [Candidatus Nealsonbacteria bacterium RIFOXYB1_FULL_40_15]OGZ27872.1 MAG: serine--tRNA ligase [Candidatus Nealsonbacteria bacterium RIFOXYC1_FULL_40_7]OGZ28031.1 MAG: serine--tRNA ligase [Candidatus Nealsonbacteria bacterium RIFOXYD1_FULL_39_11]
MLDIKFVRENPNKVKESCLKRGVSCDIEKLLKVDERRRKLMSETEAISAEKNRRSKEIAKASDKDKKKMIAEMKKIDKKGGKLVHDLKTVETEFDDLMSKVPNIIFEGVPDGKDSSENVIIEKVGEPPKFDFEFKDYMALAESLDIIDVKRAAKVAGSRFGYLKRGAVLLEFAIVKMVFDTLLEKGFVPVIPPVMLKEEMAKGTGYFEGADEDEAYFFPQDNLFLAGTSEQSLISMHAGEVLNDLPKRYVAFSTCFRREAGSYGKDTKGILRVHQFDKIEMVVFSNPEDSKKEHEFLLSIEKELMNKLELPYQVVNICTGDLGRPAAAKYDIETWIPSENKYRETHSTSNCGDFQARRLDIRQKDRQGKMSFVHTLNGTAFAIGRILIAIIENYQQKDGSIKVPEILQKYTGFKEIRNES